MARPGTVLLCLVRASFLRPGAPTCPGPLPGSWWPGLAPAAAPFRLSPAGTGGADPRGRACRPHTARTSSRKLGWSSRPAPALPPRSGTSSVAARL